MRKPKGVKVGTRRPSTYCPPFCHEIGCYDELQQVTFNGKKTYVWVNYCKTMRKVTKQSMEIMKGLFK